MFSRSLQKEETSLTKDRNHLKDREILGRGILVESWQLSTVFPDQKRELGVNLESQATTQRHHKPPES